LVETKRLAQDFGGPGASRSAIHFTLLAVIAVCYWGSYYNCGFNLGDEGVAALRSMKLLAGEVPYRDVDLHHGLLWFYPIVLLFAVFGVNFVLMKIYFFFLAGLSVLFGYLTVERVTGSRGLAFLTGLLLILVPGTIHKTYVPLIILANMYFVTRMDLAKTFLRNREVVSAAVIAAISYMMRPDLGVYVIGVICLVMTLHAFCHVGAVKVALKSNVRSAGIMIGVFTVVAAPFVVLSIIQGFFEPFLSHMAIWPKIGPLIMPAEQSGMSDSAVRMLSEVQRLHPDVGKPAARIPVTAIWGAPGQRQFAFLTYSPLVILPAAGLILAARLSIHRQKGRTIEAFDSLRLLSVLILAAGALPHFIVWRPDPPHLSQFMPGMIVLEVCLIGELVRGVKTSSGMKARDAVSYLRIGCYLAFIAILTFHVAYYTRFSLRSSSTGSIGAAKGCTRLFEAENGIRVFVRPPLWQGLTRLKEKVESSSKRDDYVVCFPFSPGVNVMTGRPTFMRDLGVHDGYLFRPGWQEETVDRISRKKPAVILVADYAINWREISRFSNWARKIMHYIEQHYTCVGEELGHKIYVRRPDDDHAAFGADETQDRPSDNMVESAR
jgi:hypothetical protein